MGDQSSLFDGPEATRREAYEASHEDIANNRERLVRFLRSVGSHGATCDEIEVATGMQFSTAGAIILGLREEGWVIQSGQTPTRPTRRKRKAVVWVLLDAPMPSAYRQLARQTKESVEERRDYGPLLLAADAVVTAYDARDASGLRAAIRDLRSALKGVHDGNR